MTDKIAELNLTPEEVSYLSGKSLSVNMIEITNLQWLVSEKASRYTKLVVNIQNLVDRSYVLSDDKYAKKLMLKEKEFCKRLDKIIKDYRES